MATTSKSANDQGTGAVTPSGDVSIADLRADLQRLSADVAALAGQMTETTKERARDTAERARQAATDQYQTGRDWLDLQMANRPLAVVGVAFAAGMLLSRSIRR